jgi:hypothetical protein
MNLDKAIRCRERSVALNPNISKNYFDKVLPYATAFDFFRKVERHT